MIDVRSAIDGFTGLKDLTVAALPRRDRIDAEHAVQRQLPWTEWPGQHAHPPVGCLHHVATTWPTLMVEQRVERAVLHEHPTGLRHVHLRHVVRLFSLFRGVLGARDRRRQQRQRHAGERATDQSFVHLHLASSENVELELLDRVRRWRLQTQWWLEWIETRKAVGCVEQTQTAGV